MGVRDLAELGTLFGAGLATVLWALAFLWRKPPRWWALLGLGALSTTALVLSGRWLGPFGIAPAVFVAHAAFFSMLPEPRIRYAMVGLVSLGMAWPLVELLATGSVANMAIVDGVITIRPLMTDFPPTATWLALVLLNLAVIGGAVFSMRILFRRLEDSQRLILWHQWQIEALMHDASSTSGDTTQRLSAFGAVGGVGADGVTPARPSTGE